MELSEFRELLGNLPDLESLVVSRIGGIPGEVQSRGSGDNCLARVVAYLDELDHGTEGENDVKLFVLGNGRVGKTQLCRRLRGDPYDESIPSTHGVEVWRTDLEQVRGDDTLTCTANWWDFGGQDIYHGTHALFLRSRAVFLVLWDPELENREEVEVEGVPGRNQPLAYWLDYVRSLAGSESPIVVVQSRCDDFDHEVAPPVSNPGFDFWRSCAYGAKLDFGREALEAQVKDAVRFLRTRTGRW